MNKEVNKFIYSVLSCMEIYEEEFYSPGKKNTLTVIMITIITSIIVIITKITITIIIIIIIIII